MIKSTPHLDEMIRQYSEGPWDYDPTYYRLLRAASDIGFRGNRELEREVYMGLCLVECFHIIRGGYAA